MKGHIRKRGKKWCIVVDLGRDDNGKRKQKWISGFRTKREAEQELARVSNKINNGIFVEPSKISIREYMNWWLEFKKANVEISTLEQYEYIVRKHIIPAFGQYCLAVIQPFQIQDIYNELLRDGLSKGTVKRIHYTLKNAFKQAVKLRLVLRNPIDDVEPPRVVRRERNVLDGNQMVQLIEATKGKTIFYMPILLAMTTGMRRGEICALRWNDIEFEKAQLKVRETIVVAKGKLIFKGYPKTKKGRRIIDLPSFTVEELKHYKTEQNKHRLQIGPAFQNHGLVCARPDGQPLHPNSVSDAFRKIRKKVGFLHVGYHDLRHSHTTQLLKQGINIKVVSERLGHANIATTLEIYAHVLPSMQEEAASAIDTALRGAFQKRKQKL